MGKKGQKRTAIVFGGSGFLGSHVCDVLSERGFGVKVFDRTPSPYLQKDQTMIIGDVLDRQKVMKAVAGCDYVYNFAGVSDLNEATTKPLDTIRFNVEGNAHILDAAVGAKAKRFIFASTIYVYSEKGGFYRCSKQASELYIEECQRQYGLDFTILRYGTVYGLRADQRNSVYRYLLEAVTKGVIEYPGSGDEVRDYINVRDAARLSVDILGEPYRNQHIILSGAHPVKSKNMMMMIREMLDKKVRIKFQVKKKIAAHYELTPYSFAPKIGYKLTDRLYVDIGQGLLECLHEIYGDLKTKGADRHADPL
ncbi:MAG: NAD(P)-dependent oxidoreductase [Candidatus Omnitrophica bacterium]|nr:NAD(P)-dependent oxidoreductase [Candidatus Omnitrophota bacterium]